MPLPSQFAQPSAPIFGGIGVLLGASYLTGHGQMMLAALMGAGALWLYNTYVLGPADDRRRLQQQANLLPFLQQGGDPEELAKMMGASELATHNLYDFLATIKKDYTGESVRGSGRLPGEDQQEAVAPGITLTLAHDLGFWYAKLVFTGETGRRFLNGEFTQWRARGKTPSEAVQNLLKKCGQSQQKRMLQDYAAKLVNEAE